MKNFHSHDQSSLNFIYLFKPIQFKKKYLSWPNFIIRQTFDSSWKFYYILLDDMRLLQVTRIALSQFSSLKLRDQHKSYLLQERRATYSFWGSKFVKGSVGQRVWLKATVWNTYPRPPIHQNWPYQRRSFYIALCPDYINGGRDIPTDRESVYRRI